MTRNKICKQIDRAKSQLHNLRSSQLTTHWNYYKPDYDTHTQKKINCLEAKINRLFKVLNDFGGNQ